MKTIARQLHSFVLLLLVSVPAFAGDRVLEVQSRVTSALSGILPRTQYLVVVNRLDSLEATGSQAVSGQIRGLPGLRVGVDDDGQVVLREGEAHAYSGPVSVTVVIDTDVKTETYRAIEALLPEIMGGARGGDEIKIKRALLRQPPEVQQPQVIVNNAAPQIDPKQMSNGGELYRVGALFLLGLGALLWMMSRRQNEQAPKRPYADSTAIQNKAGAETRLQPWNPTSFEGFDASVLGLYILKCVRDRDYVRARSFFATASPAAQRSALGAIPAWCATYCLEQVEQSEGARDAKQVSPDTIMRELTVMETALKSDPSAKASALIQWIPVEAMSKIHPESLAAPSDEARFSIISLRPDLAQAFKYDENDALVSGMIFNAKAIETTGKEMHAWRTRLVVNRTAKTTVVDAMAGIINRTETFSEAEEKLKGIRKKMSKLDWEALQPKIVCKDTFQVLTELQKKDFLRLVDPVDYYFILQTMNVADWPLETLVRPKRLAAYRSVERMNVHEEWTDEQKRAAGTRVLNHLRTVFLGEQKGASDTASAA